MLTSEWMYKILVDLGFERLEAEVYVFLAFNGVNDVLAIVEVLGVNRQHLVRVLRRLENRQIVYRSQSFPERFSVLPFDRLLDLLEKANLLETKRIEQNKESLVALWNSCVKNSGEKRCDFRNG